METIVGICHSHSEETRCRGDSGVGVGQGALLGAAGGHWWDTGVVGGVILATVGGASRPPARVLLPDAGRPTRAHQSAIFIF